MKFLELLELLHLVLIPLACALLEFQTFLHHCDLVLSLLVFLIRLLSQLYLVCCLGRQLGHNILETDHPRSKLLVLLLQFLVLLDEESMFVIIGNFCLNSSVDSRENLFHSNGQNLIIIIWLRVIVFNILFPFI